MLRKARLCLRCLKIVEQEAEGELEREKATLFFRYWLTVRKKDANDIGELARAFLGNKELRDLKGLDQIAENTFDEIDVKILEEAWEASEKERLKAQTR